MRIISGSLKGRIYASPKSELVHPMSEKMRGAIFSALGDISGLTVLDAYSGSGAVSLESASRGAKNVTAIEANKKAANIISTNIRSLGISNIKLICSSVEGWLRTSNDLFDIVIADPPYDKTNVNTAIALSSRLVGGGILILSWPAMIDLPVIESLSLIKTKNYGDSQLGFFRIR